MSADQIAIKVDQTQTVSGLLLVPAGAFACYVLAHGAGAGMTHPFMAAVAKGLHERGMGTLRYQFPFMENGSRRPDRPPAAHATVRAAVATAAHLAPTLPFIAGGKSFGARMTSQAHAETPLPNVAGLAFIGFPLHTAGKPSDDRARHLADVRIPMLFLQGTHDALADRNILTTTLTRLSGVATSHLIEYADHSFHVPARSGTTDTQVLQEVVDTLAAWARGVCQGKASREEPDRSPLARALAGGPPQTRRWQAPRTLGNRSTGIPKLPATPPPLPASRGSRAPSRFPVRAEWRLLRAPASTFPSRRSMPPWA